MINCTGKTSVVLALALLLVPAGVLAAAPISTIAAGNTVFLGEQGLDISAAMGPDTQIGWWASAADISNTAPSYTISVATASVFFINPTEFSGKLGPWYRLNSAGKANGTAFTVADPNIDIRVYDATVGVDATANGWITTGDEAEFRITTNLYQIAQRAGVSSVPIRIYVQAPNGASYSALINKAGTTTDIMAVPLTSSPYSTGAIWDTSRHDTYPYGTYSIWAECNVNSMKDNYGYSGKTYTDNWRLLDQENNPLIGASTHTASPTTKATSAATTTKTTVATTVQTTVQTTVTTPTPSPTTLTTTIATAPPTAPPAAAATKSPGFESLAAGSALLLALAFIARKE